MNPVPEYQTQRTVRYAAIHHLHERGYNVLKVNGRLDRNEVPIHLIAWNQRDLFFICTRSPRFLTHQQEDMTRLSALVRSGYYQCEIQYWFREPEYWRRYRIYAGGAVQIPGDNDDTF
jgi:hypothetical protein